MAALLITGYTLDGAIASANAEATDQEPWVVTQVDDTSLFHTYPAADLGFLFIEGRDILRHRTDQPRLV